jgi:predicted nuclease with RNAse H fold
LFVHPLFVGVDIAGGENTWLACLAKDGTRVFLEQQPRRASLAEIVQLAEQRDVVAVAVDAQLSIAVSDENGFRSSDLELRSLLPEGFRTWVASFNSLMAVPIRARMLAEGLSPAVATIIETHPRASLYFACGEVLDQAVRDYKKNGPDIPGHVDALWKAWCSRFAIEGALGHSSDSPLDSAICATVAYLLHHRPNDLFRLRHSAGDKTGRGPFFIVNPQFRRTTSGASSPLQRTGAVV